MSKLSRFQKKILACFLFLCAVLLGILLSSFLFILSYSHDFIQGEPEIMIILGCQVMEEGPSSSLADRLDKALEYITEFPEITIIVSGGQGSNEPCTEAFAMSQYLQSAGVSPAQIYEEGNSNNTHQNLTYSLLLMEEKGLEGEVLLVSSGFHLARASMLWDRVGGEKENLSRLAADVSDFPTFIYSHMREILAVVKSLLFDQGQADLKE